RTTSVTSRTAVYGPVRTVVWQGSAGDCRPYADQTGIAVTCSRFAPPAREVTEKLTFPAFSTLADYATTDQSVTIVDRAGSIAAKTVCIPALCC
ncbi:MAG: hypothetical protein WBW03_21755, partial [Silvibacterium sp.]